MDLRASLLKLYFNVESAYYEFLDAVDSHLPVYEYLVNPLENRGYPSFPVYCVALLLIVALLFFFSISSNVQTGAVYLSVTNQQGGAMSGARVTISAVVGSDSFATVASGVTDQTGLVVFVGIPMKALRIQVQKDGYVPAQVPFGSFPTQPVSITLSPDAETAARLQNEARDSQRVNADIEQLGAQGQPQFSDALVDMETFFRNQPSIEEVFGR